MVLKEFWKQATDIAETRGWDIKTWSRLIGLEQRMLESMVSGDYPDDEEALAELVRMTETVPADAKDELFHFKSPVVIASCIHKGGSGKTTCSIALADELADRGYNVLLIDSDSQMDATSTILGDGELPKKNLFNALSCGTDVREQICETRFPRLDIVPSTTKMGSADSMLMSQATLGIHPELTFRAILEELVKENYYDFVFVDMDKTVGFLNKTILAGCSHLLMTAECSIYHMSGVAAMVARYEEIKETINPDLDFLGVVFNKVTKRKSIVSQAVEDFDASLPGKRFNTLVRMDANVEKAQWANTTLRDFSPSANARKDFSDVADELLERIAPLNVSEIAKGGRS